MIFRKNVKAGTLLYALVMMGIFSLLLQFYVQMQLAAGHAWRDRQLEAQAYLMAQMVREEYVSLPTSPPSRTIEGRTTSAKTVTEKAQEPSKIQSDADDKNVLLPNQAGRIRFTIGSADYEVVNQDFRIQVQLNTGQKYRYQFPIPSQN